VNELDEYPNLVITQTLSKAYGLAGIRLGVCYASSQIIAILNKITPRAYPKRALLRLVKKFKWK
jgi:histidinol-phosphate aminotransferase